MILLLRNRQFVSQTLVYSEICLQNRSHALAIRRAFGSWTKAVDLALPLSKGES